MYSDSVLSFTEIKLFGIRRFTAAVLPIVFGYTTGRTRISFFEAREGKRRMRTATEIIAPCLFTLESPSD